MLVSYFLDILISLSILNMAVILGLPFFGGRKKIGDNDIHLPTETPFGPAFDHGYFHAPGGPRFLSAVST